jgi:acetyl-CoA carboxylase carboxyl transferase beta subunit
LNPTAVGEEVTGQTWTDGSTRSAPRLSQASTNPMSLLRAAGGELPLVKLPDSCPRCGAVLLAGTLRQRQYVCECLQHFRLPAEAWIALLADAGTWREHHSALRPADVLHWTAPVSYSEILLKAESKQLNESVRAGSCCLGGIPLWLAVFEFGFLGGTLGLVSGERLARTMEAAIAAREPFVVVAASGGARMQEGVLALMQMPKVNAVLAQLHDSGTVFISVLTDPTYGGTAASLALLADVNIAEPGAAIGFSGPRIVRRATFATLPDDFQSAAFQQDHGHIDLIVPRHELRQRLAQLLAMYSRRA